MKIANNIWLIVVVSIIGFVLGILFCHSHDGKTVSYDWSTVHVQSAGESFCRKYTADFNMDIREHTHKKCIEGLTKDSVENKRFNEFKSALPKDKQKYLIHDSSDLSLETRSACAYDFQQYDHFDINMFTPYVPTIETPYRACVEEFRKIALGTYECNLGCDKAACESAGLVLPGTCQ